MDDLIKKIVKLAGKQKEISEIEVLEIMENEGFKDSIPIFEALEKKKIKILREEDDNADVDKDDLNILELENINFDSESTLDFGDEATDPVKLYLKEIGRIPLLKLDEEKKLGEEVYLSRTAGAKLEKYNNGALKLTPAQLKKVEADFQKGNNAAKKLTEANYRLVVAIAKKYEKTNTNMTFLDLIQEGNLGLMRAVEKFDYKKGFKFSTYATWWIKQGITRSIAEKSRTIRIPVHMNETINKMNKVKRILIQELGREPSDQEIVDRVNKYDTKLKLTVEKMRYIKTISPNPLSLETPVGEEEDSSFGDLISDTKTANPHQNMVDETIMSVLDEALKENLTDREEKVLRMRTGLYNGHEYTLEEVGIEFNVTRERIRQIENKAKAKLKKADQKKVIQAVLQNKY